MTTHQALFSSSLPELYERFLVGPLFRPFAEELLSRADLAGGDCLLDVACGTGIVARVAKERLGEGARIVGVDANPGMLAIARAAAPMIDSRQGDAARLPVDDDEKFDVVAIHQGLQFFPDKPAAVLETRRVLAPHGRLALATWRSAAEIPLISELQRAAERHLGPIFDTRHSFGDVEAIRRLLAEAGFGSIRTGTVTETVRLNSAFLRLNAMALVGMSEAAKTMTDEQRARVTEAIENEGLEAAQPYADGDDLVFDLSTAMAVAVV